MAHITGYVKHPESRRDRTPPAQAGERCMVLARARISALVYGGGSRCTERARQSRRGARLRAIWLRLGAACRRQDFDDVGELDAPGHSSVAELLPAAQPGHAGLAIALTINSRRAATASVASAPAVARCGAGPPTNRAARCASAHSADAERAIISISEDRTAAALTRRVHSLLEVPAELAVDPRLHSDVSPDDEEKIWLRQDNR